MSSAICFNLDQSKILLSCNGFSTISRITLRIGYHMKTRKSNTICETEEMQLPLLPNHSNPIGLHNFEIISPFCKCPVTSRSTIRHNHSLYTIIVLNDVFDSYFITLTRYRTTKFWTDPN